MLTATPRSPSRVGLLAQYAYAPVSPDRNGIPATRQERIETPGGGREKQVKQASQTGLPPIDFDADRVDHDG